jgi:hypothetical protein
MLRCLESGVLRAVLEVVCVLYPLTLGVDAVKADRSGKDQGNCGVRYRLAGPRFRVSSTAETAKVVERMHKEERLCSSI